MGMFANMRSSMAAARAAMKELQDQAQQAASTASFGAPGPAASAGTPPEQFPPGQFPPGQVGGQPGQFGGQPGQFPPGQFPPGQFPPGQFGAPPPGQYRGAPLPFGVSGLTYDDFQPARSKRRPVLMALSLLFLIGGGGLLAYGIVTVVDEATDIRSDAVAEGNVALPNEDPPIARFTSAKAQTYSVYVDIDTSSENARDEVVANTTCVAQFVDGDTVTMRGSRQGTSNTLGDLSSIGSFRAPEGPVAVICRQSTSGRPDRELPFHVTPGTTNVFGAIGYILGGAGLLAAALVCAIFGFRRRYPTTTIAA